MSGGVDRTPIITLLQLGVYSYRSIAEQTGVSDWTVRKIARKLDGDTRAMRSPRGASSYTPDARDADDGEHSGLVGWLIAVAIATLLGVGFWRARHWDIPPDAFSDFPPEN